MNDDELRERFRVLRRHDARRAPAFAPMWRRAPARSPWTVVAPVVSLAAVAAVLLVWCGTQHLKMGKAPSLAAVSPADLDPAPLDFLLDTPGSAALSGTPDFGTER
jgi:hypothetical protein